MGTDQEFGQRSRRQKRGQAIVEMAVALIPLIVIVGGLVHFGLLGLDQSDAVMEANREATVQAMADELLVVSTGVNYLSDWREGDDEARHSVDDVRQRLSPAGIRETVLSVATPEAMHAYVPDNAFYRADEAGEAMMLEFGLVRERHARPSRPVLPVIRNLISGEDRAQMDAEAVMTWTRGLY